jgi:hypothetical protein
VPALKSVNLAVKFILELAALAAFAYWGATISVVVAIGAPLVAAVLWGRLAAPRAPRRLPLAARVPFELGVFALAALALLAAASLLAAIVFASVVIVNAVLLTALRQWEG